MNDFNNLISLLKDTFGFSVHKIHENVIELSMDKVPILRLIFDQTDNYIGICFHVTLPATEAILLHTFITQRYPDSGLEDVYYEDRNNEIHLGIDASTAYEADREASYANIENEDLYDPDPQHPISFVSRTLIYHYSHPEALPNYRKYLNRKNMF